MSTINDRILALVSSGGKTSLKKLVRATGLDPDTLRTAVNEVHAAGKIKPLPGGFWIKDDAPAEPKNRHRCGEMDTKIIDAQPLPPPPAPPDRGTPHKCPRCNGLGEIEKQYSSTVQLQACTTCFGTGILWSRG